MELKSSRGEGYPLSTSCEESDYFIHLRKVAVAITRSNRGKIRKLLTFFLVAGKFSTELLSASPESNEQRESRTINDKQQEILSQP